MEEDFYRQQSQHTFEDTDNHTNNNDDIIDVEYEEREVKDDE